MVGTKFTGGHGTRGGERERVIGGGDLVMRGTGGASPRCGRLGGDLLNGTLRPLPLPIASAARW